MPESILAASHHAAAFALIGLLCFQLATLLNPIDTRATRRLTRLDALYGLCALALLAIGFTRAALTAKGWDYYAGNLIFWAKVATYMTIGVLSIRPTMAYRAWQKAATTPIPPASVKTIRRYVVGQLVLFVPLPLLAAFLARGYGLIAPIF